MHVPPAFLCSLPLLFSACAAARPAEPEEPVVVRLVHLERAKVTDIAICLRSQAPVGTTMEVLKFGGLNSILVKGTPAQCDAMATAIRRLDRSDRP